MKKIVSMLLAGITCLAFAFASAACGGDKTNSGQTDSEQANSGQTDSEQTDSESAQEVYTVDADTLNTTLDKIPVLENFACRQSYEGSVAEILYDEGKIYTKVTAGNYSMEAFYDERNYPLVYDYSYDEGIKAWTKTSNEGFERFFEDFFDLLSKYFEKCDFSYDEEQKAYTAALVDVFEGTEESYITFLLNFVNGSMTFFETKMFADETKNTPSFSVELYDFGNAVVTLPDADE